MIDRLGLVGCGLMGGSFSLALKRAELVTTVVGYSRSPETAQRAQRLGAIDIAAPTVADAVAGCDVVLLAVPVAATETTLAALSQRLAPGALVMDVGSTKTDVVEAARRALGRALGAFVPCHPIAGKEKAGVDHADAALYQGRQVIITPLEVNLPEALDRAECLWKAVGSHVHRMSPEAHDAAFAAVSHLPHLIAFAFLNGLLSQRDGEKYMALAGPGFRDFSRIAASEPQVWRDILLANRDHVLAQSRAFGEQLAALERAIESGDAATLEAHIRQASAARSGWRLGTS